jgi:hypothetical protein
MRWCTYIGSHITIPVRYCLQLSILKNASVEVDKNYVDMSCGWRSKPHLGGYDGLKVHRGNKQSEETEP